MGRTLLNVAEGTVALTTLRESRFLKRIIDMCFLVGSALVISRPRSRGVRNNSNSSLQPVLDLFWFDICGILCGNQGRVPKGISVHTFVLFVLSWLVFNIAVVVGVVAFFGWFWLFPSLFLEQVLFYMGVYWLFG